MVELEEVEEILRVDPLMCQTYFVHMLCLAAAELISLPVYHTFVND